MTDFLMRILYNKDKFINSIKTGWKTIKIIIIRKIFHEHHIIVKKKKKNN